MASIRVTTEGDEQEFVLENSAMTIGRGLESDIRLKDIKASRRHCQILKTPQGYQCLDLESGNGTYINSVQIKQQMLSPGDQIQIGSALLVFHGEEEEEVEKVPVAVPAREKTGATAVDAAKVTTIVPAAQKAILRPGKRPGPSRVRPGKSLRPSQPSPGAASGKKSSPMKLILIGTGVLVILAGAGFFLLRGDKAKQKIEQPAQKAD